MGTVIEEILERRGVVEGGLAVVEVDKIMSHDTTTPLAIEAFERFSDKRIYRDKIIVIFDHIVPPSFTDAALNQRRMKEFCREHSVEFVEGRGICHTLMIQEGWVKPGSIVAGGDSHTLVYGVAGAVGLGMGSTDIAACWRTGRTWLEVPETIKVSMEGEMGEGVSPKDLALGYVGELTLNGARGMAIEFCGTTLERMDVYERMSIGIMATECGAMTEIFQDRGEGLIPGNGSEYVDEVEIDVRTLEPLIATPHSPDRVKAVSEVEGREVNQVFIGSCTNGTLPDLRSAASVFRGRRVNPYTRTIISPATLQIYKQALGEGLIDVFLDSGAMVSTPPGCGACLGRHLGVLGDGDVCVSTSNRNYQGRMGSPRADIYLASPVTAASSAIEGKITDPRRFL